MITNVDNKFSKDLTSGQIDAVSLFNHVLLVEDEAPHAKVLVRELEGIVGDVIVATSAAEALEIVSSTFPDLVFCDLNLPDASGLELLKKIREILPGVPVIIMTVSSNLENAVSAMREGAWDYMVKDFSTSLRNSLSLAVQRAAIRRAHQVREFKLRGERNAFWAAVQRASDGLGILSTEGVVVFGNATFNTFCHALGGVPNNSEPFRIADLIAPFDRIVSQGLEERLHSGGQDLFWTSELMVKPENQDSDLTYYYELTLNTVQMDEVTDGFLGSYDIPELRKFVLWVRDVTRRKERERFQRDLLSTTTHDLKGPLGAILTSAELISEAKDDERINQDDLILRISSCARNSITLIDELLSARRIQDGVLIVRPQWFLVHEILEDIVLDFYPVAQSRKVDLSVKNGDPSLMVFADKIGINRILGNLVSNAIKFGGQGGKVRLSAEKKEGEVQLVVSDTGPGIAPQERLQLFERYQRLEQHGGIEGTGLGLFVCKNIVGAHGGRIDVLSQVDKGTRFIVSFPDEVKDV